MFVLKNDEAPLVVTKHLLCYVSLFFKVLMVSEPMFLGKVMNMFYEY